MLKGDVSERRSGMRSLTKNHVPKSNEHHEFTIHRIESSSAPLARSVTKTIDFKSSTTTKGDTERKQTRFDAKNGFPTKFCIDIIMQFLSQM